MLRRISLGFGNASPSLPRSLGEPVPKRKEIMLLYREKTVMNVSIF